MNMSWNDILKKYREYGIEWGSLAEEVHPAFLRFIEAHAPFNAVLDIGFGDGRYLELLEPVSSKLCGVDESKEAIKLAREKVEHADLKNVSVFDFKFPKQVFDLIISFSAIHHGDKKEVVRVLGKLQRALSDNGYVLLTLPGVHAQKTWKTFIDARDLGDGTFVPVSGPEKGIKHSFFTEEEIVHIFEAYNNVRIAKDDRSRWVIEAQNRSRS